jgi:IS5 family transposase
MSTSDFFRARLDQMIDLRHPLAVLARRMPWDRIERELAPFFAHRNRGGTTFEVASLFGPTVQVAGAGVSNAGRPRLPIRLMVALLYLKHAYNESDESLVERWSQDVYFQYFSGLEYFEARVPCDPSQIGRFRTAIGEAGVETILKATIDTAVATKAVTPSEFERVIVDSTVQEKAIAFPTGSRLLEIARYQVVKAAKAAGISLKRTCAAEGKLLRRRAGGYAHARQFKRLHKVLKRQRTILGIVMRETERKMVGLDPSSAAVMRLKTVFERAQALYAQKPKDKDKLYAMHAPEVECIGKGKARQPYEFGVKTSIAITHKAGLVVGARTFPGNPYDGHTLSAQLEQTTILLEDTGVQPKQVFVDLGYRGVDADNPGVEIIHRGKGKTLTKEQRRWLKRRQAIEPVIGHLKADHRMNRCWLKGAMGDAINAVLSAAGYNLRWLLRAVAAGTIKRFYFAWILRRILSDIARVIGATRLKPLIQMGHPGRQNGVRAAFAGLAA